MSAKKQCTCDSGPDVAGAYHSDPACPVHFPKKRPKVPRGLLSMFWRVRHHGFGGCSTHTKRRDAVRYIRTMAKYPVGVRGKLYRVTVWRKR